MNIEKTVKGLHYCTKWESIEDCTECPYLHSPDNCTIRLLKDALATIDELQAEKEEFRKFVHAAFEEAKTYYAEGVKKMQDKLKATFCPDADYFGCDIHSAINEKAKEVLEGIANDQD